MMIQLFTCCSAAARTGLRWTRRLSILAATLGVAAGCESITDEQGDCDPHYAVEFSYTRHLESQDGCLFDTAVQHVQLYIFETATGRLVEQFDREVSDLTDKRLPIPDGVLEAGKSYDFLAWCTTDRQARIEAPGAGSTQYEAQARRIVTLHLDDTEVSSEDLDDLFHGDNRGVRLSGEQGLHLIPIALTKDTNLFTIMMHHTDGPIDPQRFRIEIEDDNTLLDPANRVVFGLPIHYRPWAQRYGSADGSASVAATTRADEQGYLVSEITTGRMVEENREISKLRVTDLETGTVVFTFPLIEYIQLMKSQRYAQYSLQEYMDRNHRYDMAFMLVNSKNEPGSWFAVQIEILGWHYVQDEGTGLGGF